MTSQDAFFMAIVWLDCLLVATLSPGPFPPTLSSSDFPVWESLVFIPARIVALDRSAEWRTDLKEKEEEKSDQAESKR